MNDSTIAGFTGPFETGALSVLYQIRVVKRQISSSPSNSAEVHPSSALLLPPETTILKRDIDEFAAFVDVLATEDRSEEGESVGKAMRSFLALSRRSALSDAHALIVGRQIDMLNHVLRCVADSDDNNSKGLLRNFLQSKGGFLEEHRNIRTDTAEERAASGAQRMEAAPTTGMGNSGKRAPTPRRPPWCASQQVLTAGLFFGIWIVLECAVELSAAPTLSSSPEARTLPFSPRVLATFLIVAFLLGRDSVWAQSVAGDADDGTTAAFTKTAQIKSNGKNKKSPILALSPVIREAGILNPNDDEDDEDDEDEDESWRDFEHTTTIAPRQSLDGGGGNKWSEPPGKVFWLRGLRYLEDKEKVSPVELSVVPSVPLSLQESTHSLWCFVDASARSTNLCSRSSRFWASTCGAHPRGQMGGKAGRCGTSAAIRRALCRRSCGTARPSCTTSSD